MAKYFPLHSKHPAFGAAGALPCGLGASPAPAQEIYETACASEPVIVEARHFTVREQQELGLEQGNKMAVTAISVSRPVSFADLDPS